jgi:hypothetical protein
MKEADLLKYEDELDGLEDWDSQRKAVREAFMRGYEQATRENRPFKEDVFEIAFGDDAIDKDYTQEEVTKKLREFSDLALEVEQDD